MNAPILYIEDEEDYQLLVRRILNRAGLEVVIAETGAEGLAILKRERPSLLILDINLPDMSGYAICSELRQDSAWIDLPILMLTVRRRPDEWLRGFASGANDYISKPINPPELVERVVNCLENKAHHFTGNGTAEYNLIQAAVAGNRAAFEVLIQKYRQRLIESLAPSVRNDVHLEDIVSHAFAIAFESLGDFRGEASFFTWVYRIAMNESVAAYRKPDSVSLDELSDGQDSRLQAAVASEEPLDKLIADKAMGHRALETLERLPPPYREVLELFFLQDLSYELIAKKLRIPQGTVMSRLHKARQLLQDAWHKVPATTAR
jgi:RNA polymerase sigma-70 factor (ECF subfamily)